MTDNAAPSVGFNGAAPMKARKRRGFIGGLHQSASFNGAAPMKARKRSRSGWRSWRGRSFNGAAPMKARKRTPPPIPAMQGFSNGFSSGRCYYGGKIRRGQARPASVAQNHSVFKGLRAVTGFFTPPHRSNAWIRQPASVARDARSCQCRRFRELVSPLPPARHRRTASGLRCCSCGF